MLQGGYVPPVDQTFTVMTFGSRSGTFGDLTGLNVGSGRAFEPGYNATSLSLRAYQTNDVVIFTQPQPLTVVAGSPAAFSVTASGTGTLTYEWRRDGTVLANADTNRFVIPNAQPGNAGGYDVIVSSTSGSATSHVASLTVHVPPSIVAPPVNRSVGTGAAADFSVGATGIPAPSYQWYFNGAPIAGATAADYSVTAAMTGNVGAYSVVVSNAAGSVTNTVHLALVDLKMFAGIVIDAELGARFRVDFTTDINTPTTNWIDLGTVTLTNRPHFFFDLDSPGAPKRFYRAVPLPAP